MFNFLKREKNLLILVITGVLGFGIAMFLASGVGNALSVEVEPVRIHVIANSNSTEDQAYKLLVRDAIVEVLTPLLEVVDTQEEAIAIVQEKMAEMEFLAGEIVAELGYGAEAQFGVFEFPDRDYGEVFYPAGEYTALKIVLGEGVGDNWWCVLFPPLCFVEQAGEVVEEVPAMVGDVSLASGEYFTIKLKFFDWLD